MLKSLISALLGSFLETIVGYFQRREEKANDRKQGAQQATIETQTEISRVGDKQVANSAKPRDLHSIADRLRGGGE